MKATLLTLPLLLLAAPATAQSSVVDASNPGQLGATVLGGSQALGVATSAADDFDRPDGTDLGPNWTEQAGDLQILGNEGAGTSGVSWMSRNGLAQPYAESVQEIDFLPEVTGAGVIFVALVAGIGASSDNIFVKVQDNTSDGIYDRVFFYRGINGGSLGSVTSQALITPTASGRMRVSFSPDGDSVICEIDNNFDGVFEEQIVSSGLLGAGLVLGGGFGISTFNDAKFDNWNVNGGIVGTAYCFGDGTGPVCPCGNNSSEESGCVNSSGLGAILSADGDATVGADSLVLRIEQAPAATPGLFFSAPNPSGGSLFGDGELCVSGPILRLQVAFTDAAGSAASTASLSTIEGLAGGELRHYQYWYRDVAGPCSQGFNTSNGLAIQW